VRDKNYGVNTIPLFTVRSSVPSGIPIGRKKFTFKVNEDDTFIIYT
jgi:hypothetical protein